MPPPKSPAAPAAPAPRLCRDRGACGSRPARLRGRARSLPRLAVALLGTALAALGAAPGGATAVVGVAALASAGVLAAPAARAAQSEAEAREELAKVRARIREVTRRVQADVARRDRSAAALKQADESLEQARTQLDEVRAARADSERRRRDLEAEQARTQQALEAEREALAAQLRSAYFAGREEQLRVLLNADDPVRLARMLAYYAELGRVRAERLAAIREQAARLEELDLELAAEVARLAELEERRRGELANVESARERREAALREVQASIQTRNRELKQLRANAQSLESLVEQLRKALAELRREEFVPPGGPRQAFANLRGKLPWPARGKVVANFGQSRPGGLRWNGVLLETAPGARVRAPYYGQVIYADWLAGLGLLLILDHGGGYLSLYAHNEKLLKAAGDRVAPGDVLAESGPAGAGGRPELYFELRRGTRPVDPRPWLRGKPDG